MRTGPQAVARVFGKRIAPLVVLLAVFALLGDPRGGGVLAGLILAAAAAFTATIGGIALAMQVFAPAVLRSASTWGVALGLAAGMFASSGAAFNFIIVEIAGRSISVGGALLHLAAFVTVASVGALVFFGLGAREPAVDDPR
ncbi:MAG: hypothetical protein JNM47_00585 [Hyphomonadaceae bacterium]|nr:hypothetical protein [Hyphomonadaceae bacterium]